MPESLRVIVVGGGPAGSLAALLLARGGARVELIEQSRFPRDKVCGECLSALGISVLQRSGLADRLLGLGPVRLVRTLFHPIDGPTVPVPLPLPMWGLTRAALDTDLLAAAADAGVVTRQPARCERVATGPLPTVTWRDLTTNQSTTSEADLVVVADGKGAFPTAPPRPTGDIGIKCHLVGVNGPRDAIEVFAGPGCYGGLAPVERNRWNAAFAVPAVWLREVGGDPQLAFDRVVERNETLARRMRGAHRPAKWLAAPLPRFAVAAHFPMGVVPVGNAAAALEPIGGEGMGLALRSAELAAESILSGRLGEPVRDRLPNRFANLWSVRRLVCRSVARAVSHPEVTDLVGPLLSDQPGVIRLLAGWAGKKSVRQLESHRGRSAPPAALG